MNLGVIGRGPWGKVYETTLHKLGIDHWTAGRDWPDRPNVDGLIIASCPESHYWIARQSLRAGLPTLIEKPITLKAAHARELLRLATERHGIVFAGHTRLYSPAWREFKKQVFEKGVRSVCGSFGGPCNLSPWWDFGPHLVAMTIDLGFDPAKADLLTFQEEVPLVIEVNESMYFRDVLTTSAPLEVLIAEFVAAIEAGKSDIRGLALGVKVVEYLETAAAGHRALGENHGRASISRQYS